MTTKIEKLILRGLEQFNQGEIEQAENIFKKILKIEKNDFNALHHIGLIEMLRGDNQAAVNYIRKAVAAYPNSFLAYSNLSVALQNIGEPEQAVEAGNRSIALRNNYPHAYLNRGYALMLLKQYDKAVSDFSTCVVLGEKSYKVYLNRGIAFLNMERWQPALEDLDRAIGINPDSAEAYFNKANILVELGRLEEAQQSIDKSFALKIDNVEAYNTQGMIYLKLGRLGEALAAYEKAIELNPKFAEAYAGRGNVLSELGLVDEGVESYREALRLDPDYDEVRQSVLFNINYLETVTPIEILDEALKCGGKISTRSQPKFTIWNCNPSPKKLRVGFVSGDFNNHPIGYFTENILRHLCQKNIELIAYATVPKSDALTERLKPLFTEWRLVAAVADKELAELIYKDELHILVDLAGHTSNNRLSVFGFKPAPLQLSWLGYCGTTGLKEIDFILGDRIVTPIEDETHFCENIWRLPEAFWCLTTPNEAAPVETLPFLRNGYVTFGCFNTIMKINATVIEVWSRLLASMPESRLFLKAKQLGDKTVASEFRERFCKNGIDPDRIHTEGPSSRDQYFSRYNEIDIALDPFPYSGGTTSIEALWMGVPVLTRKGNRFYAHLGESIMHSVNMPDWIADDTEDYILKAKQLSQEPEKLAKIRFGLREKIRRSSLFDSESFATNLENAFWEMWQMHTQKSQN